MHAGYEDILEAAAGKVPQWWDQNGVPRFREHHPSLSSDIYATEVVLLRIACQRCLLEQLVQMTWGPMDTVRWQIRAEWAAFRTGDKPAAPSSLRTLADGVRDGSIYYGDPPRHDVQGEFCHAGCTMNVWDLKIEEFWARKESDWVRVADLEIILPDDKPCVRCAAPTPEGACAEGPQHDSDSSKDSTA